MKVRSQLSLVVCALGAMAVSAYAEGRRSLPLTFEESRDPAERGRRFRARGDGYEVVLTPTGATLALAIPPAVHSGSERAIPTAEVVELTFPGSTPPANLNGLDETAGRSNYLIGPDSKAWVTGLRNYRRVRYASLYPATDLVFYGHGRELEFDLILGPGADPGLLKVGLSGASITLDDDGNAVVQTAGREVRLHAPVAYQEEAGVRRPVPARYELTSANELTFRVAPYDTGNSLVIDPVLSYSSYLGGSDFDFLRDVAVDRDGNAYATGFTCSFDFPMANALQTERGGGCVAFVSKFDSTGSDLVYSTYLGGIAGFRPGGGFTEGHAIAVDSRSHAHVVGSTNATDFPVQNPLQGLLNGPGDAFVAELDVSGAGLVYSTFLGGSGSEQAIAVAVDTTGAAYVAGRTTSSDFPLRQPLQGASRGLDDVFVTKIRPGGSGLVFSTYVGGSSNDHADDIALDADLNVHVVGYTSSPDFPTTLGALQRSPGSPLDAVVFKVRKDGRALQYATYLGGNSDEYGLGIAVDRFGSAHVGGATCSTNFPLRSPAQPTLHGTCAGFVARFAPSGSQLVYSTYLGGSDDADNSYDFVIRVATQEGTGTQVFTHVSGQTCSAAFPLSRALQPTYGGLCDAFLTRFGSSGSILFSTYIGGSDKDQSQGLALDRQGAVYVGGTTCSSDFPVSGNAAQPIAAGACDAFVSKIPAKSLKN